MRIERVLANNPGVFTGPGTNTWLLADDHGSLAVIDPGPIDFAHMSAVIEAVGPRTPEVVLVTHTHPDHAPLANPLARELAVPAVGYGPGPEFDPDQIASEGNELKVGALSLDVVHTPGHSPDHLCFRVGDILFSGDHIMGGSSVMVEDLGAYLRSLRALEDSGLKTIYPGHGETVEDPDSVIDWYLAHRLQRHEEIYAAVAGGATNVADIVEVVYAEVDRNLHPLAAQSVRAHLVLLNEELRIAFDGDEVVSRPPQDQ